MEERNYTKDFNKDDEGNGDPDTCRICRGEGDPSESLFHPCKCSGSIKFVHQDCLKEWLSHSQKKHCELCKTAFRFTKLYSPNMPQSLPFHILIRHGLKHTFRVLLTLLRFCLVIMVWLGLLPYTIRQVWRFLFWLSEGGWPPNDLATIHNGSSNVIQELQIAQEVEFSTLVKSEIALETPISTNITNNIFRRTVVDRLTQFLIPVSHALRISGSDDIATSLFKSIYNLFGAQNSGKPEREMIENSLLIKSKSSSLLSEVSFFKNLTRNPSFNQLVINITEGYIITVLVVVCFVLVFLIREWVVQQQPGINIGAGFNAELPPNERPIDNLDPARIANIQGEIDPTDDVAQNLEGHVIQRNPDLQLTIGAENIQNRQLQPFNIELGFNTETQRNLTDESQLTEEFTDLWTRVNGNQKEFMRVIESEGKTERFDSWMDSMEAFVNRFEMRNAPKILEPEPTLSMLINEASQSLNGDLDIIKQAQENKETSASVRYLVALTESAKLKTVSHSPNQDSVIHSNISGFNTHSHKDKGKSQALEHELTMSLKTKCVDNDETTAENPSHDDSTLLPSTDFEKINTENNSSSWPLDDNSISKTSFSFSTNNWSFPKELADDGKDKLNFFDDLFNNRGQLSKSDSSNTEKIDSFYDSATEKEKNIASEASNKLKTQEMLTGEQESCQNWLQNHALHDLIGKNEGDKEDIDEILTNKQNSVIETCADSSASIGGQSNPQPPLINSPQVDDPPNAKLVPQTILGSVTEYLWGEIDERPHELLETLNGEVTHSDAEVPQALVANNNNLNFENNAEVMQGAAQANNAEGVDAIDPEIIEDAEDFEGIMELLGMRGPIFSLVQNALFSALLLGLTITVGVWFPYNIGRVSILLLANPGSTLKVPLKILFGCAAFIQDLALSILGLTSSICIQLLAQPYNLWSSYFGLEPSLIASQTNFLASAALEISSAAFHRFKNDAINNFILITDSEMSAACHESLIIIQSLFSTSFANLVTVFVYLFSINYSNMSENIATALKFSSKNGLQIIKSLPSSLIKSNMWMININENKHVTPINLELSTWSGFDRFLAITTGYVVLCAIGTLYVRKRSPLLSGLVGHEIETAVVDLLRQAGGVMKVILIISIEMLIFPLYCGLLLDISLLPLLENTTVVSRVVFTLKSPLTSIFVHWFIGTCYMFHFALFVSMCRKILRRGVLYFIRDPDDPTFHPVRDVLERNVATQLQKILFSALVYGALILICLGGVVWGISLTLKGVLPIYWSSNEPVLEFPIDLLFYNFLIPFAVKFFKPSTKLHAMYSWWFRKCARALRLTWFMFDERMLDEERHLVRRTWLDVFRRSKADPNFLVLSGNPKDVFIQNPDLRAYYHRDGFYVRAPASDQVRIPKGSNIFLEVNEWNERIDQKPDQNDGIHGKESDLCKLVYIPPWFRVRISIFITSIWIFAAITGVGVTILPLVVGRIVFSITLPPQVRKNDAYAFSIGIYILGSIIYCAFNLKSLLKYMRRALVFDANAPKKLLNYVVSIVTQVARITWTYTAFLLVLPTLFAFLIEFYLIVPLHTYLAIEEKHVVHFVQSWTLGLLYVKLTARLILWYEDSRPAQSLRAITRNGYLNPDARLATRSFIIPGALLLSTALLYPWAIARLVIITIFQRSPEKHTLTYRYSYPICLCLCFLAIVLWVFSGWIRNWKIKIRNEVYLIGEQLHNYGENKTQQGSEMIQL